MTTSSFYNNKRVLVAGAAGFIPSHLVDQLLKLGATVVGVDSFITGNAENLEEARSRSEFSFIHADVSKPTSTYLPQNTQPFDVIFHMASPASPPRYQAHPVETYMANAMGTHELLQYINATNKDCRFVFASTSEVYGNPLEHPQKETYWGNVNPNGVRSCYDEAKRFGEMVCGVHDRNFRLNVRIARIFNTYGPRMDIKDGRVIPNFLSQALRNEAVTIYGTGKQTRSLCYVSDLVEGLLLLGAVDSARSQTINLGNPNEMSMNDLASSIIQSTNSSSSIEYHELPKDDPERRKPDITRAGQILGWQPVVSFEEGIEKTIQYFKGKV